MAKKAMRGEKREGVPSALSPSPEKVWRIKKMKKFLIVAILALSTLALSQTDPRLVATPTGYGLKPGTTSFSGLLGDLFTQNFGQLPAGGPPLGNFVVPCNQSFFDPNLGSVTAGCSIVDA